MVMALSLTSLITVNAQTLAEFGSSASNLFTLDSGSFVTPWSASNTVQTTTGISVNSTDANGAQFGGLWNSPWNLASNSGLQINITGTAPSPGSLFTVTLFSPDLSSNKTFEGSFAESSVIGNNYSLSFQTESASFTSIGGLTFTAGGTGNGLNLSVNNLSVVPEPSTYALMAIGGLLLFYIARRRKAQQV